MFQTVFSWLINGIGQAFTIMSDFTIIDGSLTLLGFFVGILILHVLYDIFMVNWQCRMSDANTSRRAALAEKSRLQARDAYNREKMDRHHNKK